MEPLTLAEQLVLLDPEKSWAGEAVKVSLLSLVDQGTLKLGNIRRATLFGSKTVLAIYIVGPPSLARRDEATMFDVVNSAQDSGVASLENVAIKARKQWGRSFHRFKTKNILPALVTQRLLNEKKRIISLPFWPSAHTHTHEGAIERRRILELTQANQGLLKPKIKDPNAAATLKIIAGLRPSLIPVLEESYNDFIKYDWYLSREDPM